MLLVIVKDVIADVERHNPTDLKTQPDELLSMFWLLKAVLNVEPASYFQVTEDNSTTAYVLAIANLLSSTTAISSLTFGGYGFNFVSGSSFYLYGIKNS